MALLYNFYHIINPRNASMTKPQHFKEKANTLEKYLELLTTFYPREESIVLRDKKKAKELKKYIADGMSMGYGGVVKKEEGNGDGNTTPRNSKSNANANFANA